MRILTDPGHAIVLAIVVAIVLGIYLVRRRRRDADPDVGGDDHQHGSGHEPADPERHL